jgi:hypothetical protein
MVPSQVTGSGSEVEPTRTALTTLPQASVMSAGAPGSVASDGQDTVDEVLVGAVKPPL